ncbi:hypothetical protein L1887_33915 [Cichorium endivia]|nr:hypothetical protein L1887_33915 [Cichorium endivia]
MSVLVGRALPDRPHSIKTTTSAKLSSKPSIAGGTTPIPWMNLRFSLIFFFFDDFDFPDVLKEDYWFVIIHQSRFRPSPTPVTDCKTWPAMSFSLRCPQEIKDGHQILQIEVSNLHDVHASNVAPDTKDNAFTN